jgi:hypothetical protein
MTIVYDAEAKRATHVESGLSVRFLHYGPYPKEPDAYFEAKFGQHVLRFRAACIGSYQKIADKNPTMSPGAVALLAFEMGEQDYKYQSAEGDGLDSFIGIVGKENVEIFLETWALSAKNATKVNKTTVFIPFGDVGFREFTL